MAAAADLRAEKQLDTMYTSVDPLNDVGFHKFSLQLHRQAFRYDWPSWILGSEDQPETIDPADRRHCKNAYMLIMNKADGHQAENVLETVPPGEAKQAWNTIYRFFHKDTIAGKAAATANFYTASM